MTTIRTEARVVILTGARGSGKSSIARELHKLYGFATTSFGEVVREEASSRSLGTDVSTLQTLGEELIQEWGWAEFCRRVIGRIKPSHYCVVDGVRHVAAFRTISSQFATLPLLVFVTLDLDERRRRLLLRNRNGELGLGADTHSTERELALLQSEAALVVNGQSSVDAAKLIHDHLVRLESVSLKK